MFEFGVFLRTVMFTGVAVIVPLTLLHLTAGDEAGNSALSHHLHHASQRSVYSSSSMAYVTDCTSQTDVRPFSSSTAPTDCQLTNIIAEAGTRLSVPFACPWLTSSRVLWSFTAINSEDRSGYIHSSVSSRSSSCTNVVIPRVDSASAGLYTAQTRKHHFAAVFLLVAVERPTCDARSSNTDDGNALLTCSAVYAGNVPPHLEWVGLDRCNVTVNRINDSASRVDCRVNATSILVSKAVCKLTGEADVTGLMHRVAGLATDFASFCRECWPTPDADASKHSKLSSSSYAHTRPMSSAQPNSSGPETAQIAWKLLLSLTAIITAIMSMA